MPKDIKEQFNQNAELYDSQRRLIIPCLDELYNIMAEQAHSDLLRPKILDLGAGTGLLTKHIFDRYGNAEFTLVDLSEEMLKIAEERFVDRTNFKYIIGDYIKYDFKGKYDIICSSLSIHHLKHQDIKFLYGKIYQMLNKDGVFLNADQVLGPSQSNEEKYQKNWHEKIDDKSLQEEEKELILERMKLDNPATLDDNLKWLKKIGFVDVDVYYKYYNFVVLYGKRI
ncbi:MAG: class I SAM-dependent methyltransferase [Methanobacterium sp.]|nr:class I SAM-dependent methyltransferase [Methanobacterium sp.]